VKEENVCSDDNLAHDGRLLEVLLMLHSLTAGASNDLDVPIFRNYKESSYLNNINLKPVPSVLICFEKVGNQQNYVVHLKMQSDRMLRYD